LIYQGKVISTSSKETKVNSARRKIADLPILVKDISKFAMGLVEKESETLLEGGGGAVGLLIRIFGQYILEKRRENTGSRLCKARE
jgi:hypothetical protein